MPAPVLTVTLNPAVDRTVNGARVKLSAGGKGINVSRALKALGVDSIVTGLAGGKAGDFIRSALRRERISERLVGIRGESRKNLTVIGRGGKITRRIEKGPAVSAEEFREFKKMFAKLLRGRRYVVFSGANANGLKDSAYAELIGIAKKNGVMTALDTRDAALKEGLKAKPDIVKPNIKEARYICGRDPMGCLRAKGARTVLLTMGRAGAAATDGKDKVNARPPRVKAVNDVGCGDAFLAGFIAYRLKGKGFKESVRAATAAGAANAAAKAACLVPGSFKRKDFLEMLSQTDV
ncbi:MAG: hexose kinase [Candidatus Omnitrophica bacterium]|nr:hexose kinase [Candidatus Omnitrophota bacterium]MDD5737254.1 hexose kinase [Candidatus Omnitrophota bacterium]